MKRFSIALGLMFLFGMHAFAEDLIIKSAEDWKVFAQNPATYSSGSITLAADIHAGEMFAGSFAGTFDGQGHTITLEPQSPGKFALFASSATGAVFKNFVIAGNVQTNVPIAGLVLETTGHTVVEQVQMDAHIKSGSYPVSGFVLDCKSDVLFKRSSFTGSVTSTASVSADIAGYISIASGEADFDFYECSATGAVNVLNGWRASAFVSTNKSIKVSDCEFINCIMASKIEQANGSERIGGFVGSPDTDKSAYILRGCLATGTVKRWDSNSTKTWISSTNGLVMGCNAWRKYRDAVVENCMYTASTEYVDYKSFPFNFAFASDEDVVSGKLCYLLNSDQKSPVYRQKLGDGGDAYPTLDASHPIVYCIGRKHCDGSDYEQVTYNNVGPNSITIDDHNYTDGICGYCHDLQLDAEGYFVINSAARWEAFKTTHNAGNLGIKVKLGIDVALTEPLADGYCGVFDGQGHVVTLNMEGEGKYSMFGNMAGATVRNVVFEGKLTGASNCAPVASYVSSNCLIENVISKINVVQTSVSDGNCSGMVGFSNADLTMRNCIFAGTVNATKDAGGFVGWSAGRTLTMDNCAMIGDVTVGQGASSIFLRVRHDCKFQLSNLYYAPCTPVIHNGNNAEKAPVGKLIEKAQIASGALCYMLNGDQTHVTFFQKIGTDPMPMLDASRGQVYANGRKHCDGTDYPDLSYNNSGGNLVVDSHNYVDGVCDFCGKLQLDEKGYFHIVSDKSFAAFAREVNRGNSGLCAVMEDNIYCAMGKDTDCPMIGLPSTPYTGTFDGKGYTLNVNVDAGNSDGGVFKCVGKATIKNLVVEGSITNALQAGLAATSSTSAPSFINIVNKLNVSGTLNVAGFLGVAGASDTHRFVNCMFAGRAVYAGTANANGIGGFIGWSGNAKVDMAHCAMIADIDLGAGTTPAHFIRVNAKSSVKSVHCAYIARPGIPIVSGSGNAEIDAAPVSVENAATGELCYILNGNGFQNPVWRQNVGEDEHPWLDQMRGVVYRGELGFTSSRADESSIVAMIEDIMAEAMAFADPYTHPAQKVLINAYLAEVANLETVSSFDALVAAYYPKVQDARALLEQSVKAYSAYTDKIKQTEEYLSQHANDFKGGPLYDKLFAYLNEYIDPNEDYPNGTYAYIISAENLLLDVDALETEKRAIDKMLEDALNEGLNPGADVTSLLVNANFAEGFTGWGGTLMNTVASNDMGTRIVESWSGKAFDMYQTIQVPENGIYEMDINGAYRIANVGDSKQHAAMAYLNGNEVYLQNVLEGMIPVQDAVNKQNCWIEGDVPDFAVTDETSGEIIGYTVHGQQGAAYAFQANRYANKILVNVTDGQLTVGVRNQHSITQGNEWAAIGNIKLTYRGAIDKAGEALDATLQGMKERALFMLNQYEVDYANYRMYPNYSVRMQETLRQKVESIPTLATNEQKYQLIVEMGDLFNEIYQCKVAYADMLTMAEGFQEAVSALKASGMLSAEDEQKANVAYETTTTGFVNGKYSTTEAAAGGDLIACGLLPQKDENGAFVVSTGVQLHLFASIVNAGLTAANVVLASDVEISSSFPMIGFKQKYEGVFDGQGHKVTAMLELPDMNAVGIFRNTGDATIKNVTFTGGILGAQNTGLVAYINGNTKFYNVESNLIVQGTNNVGGFAGNATGGTQVFDNCLFSGHVTATTNGGGGFYGWSSTNHVIANNCLSIGEVTGEQCAYFFRVKCKGTIGDPGAGGCTVDGGNMYFLRTSDPSVLVSGTPLWWGEFLTDVILEVSAEDLASGKVCYTLNQGNTTTPVWLQTLGEDATPLLMSNHKVVYFDGTSKYYNKGGDGIADIEDANRVAPNIYYNLSGQRVAKPGKGLFIVNGRKILMK